MKKLLLILLVINSIGCTRNVEFVKKHATEKWNELGYQIQGYEGFQYSLAGGDVWYLLKRKDTPGVLYSGYLQSYYNEIQVYGPQVKSGQQLNLSREGIEK